MADRIDSVTNALSLLQLRFDDGIMPVTDLKTKPKQQQQQQQTTKQQQTTTTPRLLGVQAIDTHHL